jgi:hypothetical protein
MQIAKPQVHLKKNNSNGTYYIHVVTWFDRTKFKSAGVASIATTATGGVFPVVLSVEEDNTVQDMELLTPVVHTVTLTGVSLDSNAPFVEVTIINTSDDDAEMGKRKTHKDDADDTAMPNP